MQLRGLGSRPWRCGRPLSPRPRGVFELWIETFLFLTCFLSTMVQVFRVYLLYRGCCVFCFFLAVTQSKSGLEERLRQIYITESIQFGTISSLLFVFFRLNLCAHYPVTVMLCHFCSGWSFCLFLWFFWWRHCDEPVWADGDECMCVFYGASLTVKCLS